MKGTLYLSYSFIVSFLHALVVITYELIVLVVITRKVVFHKILGHVQISYASILRLHTTHKRTMTIKKVIL